MTLTHKFIDTNNYVKTFMMIENNRDSFWLFIGFSSGHGVTSSGADCVMALHYSVFRAVGMPENPRGGASSNTRPFEEKGFACSPGKIYPPAPGSNGSDRRDKT